MKNTPTNKEIADFYGLTSQTISNYNTSKNEKYKRILAASKEFYLKSKESK